MHDIPTHDIDFLPSQYRQKHAQRQSRPWQLVVVIVFGLLLGAAALGYRHGRTQVEAELAAITPPYELAVSQNFQLNQMQPQLQKARSTAELLVYLRHPWPRTQLLVALLAPLPEEVVFEQLHIARERPPVQPLADHHPHPEKPLGEEELSKLTPADRDLRHFREECDKMQTVIHLSGTTAESGALHRYLSELGQNSLFAKANLDSLESLEGKGPAAMKFRATLIVRPGYGQPGGPKRPEKDIKNTKDSKDSLAQTGRGAT
jgi:hypothetical protein